MGYKVDYKRRMQQTQYKLANWDYVREYMRNYMAEYRKTKKGKVIAKRANETYSKRNRTAKAMYSHLLVYADGQFPKNLPKTRTIIQDGTKPRNVKRK